MNRAARDSVPVLGIGGCGGAREKLHLSLSFFSLSYFCISLSKLTESLRSNPSDLHANVSELHEHRKQQRGKTADHKQACVWSVTPGHMAWRSAVYPSSPARNRCLLLAGTKPRQQLSSPVSEREGSWPTSSGGKSIHGCII